MRRSPFLPSHFLRSIPFLLAGVLLVMLLLQPLSATAGSRDMIRPLTPAAQLYLSIVMNRPSIGDVGHLLITEAVFDPDTQQGGVEWIEIFNPTGDVVDLSEFKLGDEESIGGNEGMLHNIDDQLSSKRHWNYSCISWPFWKHI